MGKENLTAKSPNLKSYCIVCVALLLKSPTLYCRIDLLKIRYST